SQSCPVGKHITASGRTQSNFRTDQAVRYVPATLKGDPGHPDCVFQACGGARSQYRQPIPPSVPNAFTTVARARLMREEPLYRDVASYSGIRWELLAACDWMQCEARTRYSPVRGEKLGTLNPDGTIYRTRSEALAQCADDLVE